MQPDPTESSDAARRDESLGDQLDRHIDAFLIAKDEANQSKPTDPDLEPLRGAAEQVCQLNQFLAHPLEGKKPTDRPGIRIYGAM